MARKKRGRSKVGWIFCLIYGVIAIYLFDDAMTCKGWFCSWSALPVFWPAGLICTKIYNCLNPDYVADPERRWGFVIPSAMSNAALYYFIGYALSNRINHLRKRAGFDRNAEKS